MELINVKTNTKIVTKNKSLVARLIGVDRRTVFRWGEKGVDQEYNHWLLKFK